ncbi:MAG: PDZ domain-containing protein, partial [Bacteroidota bacterium]
QTQSYTIAAAKLSVAGFEVEDFPVRLSGSTQGVTNSQGSLGLLGAQVINRFQVVLDYQRNVLYLKPNSHFQDPFHFPMSGFGVLWKDEEVQVGFVVPGSQAEQAGLVEGMEILSIDGESASTLDQCRELLRQEGKEVTVVVADGEEKKTVVITLDRLI